MRKAIVGVLERVKGAGEEVAWEGEKVTPKFGVSVVDVERVGG